MCLFSADIGCTIKLAMTCELLCFSVEEINALSLDA
jgi:hypothetical protein